MAFPVTPPFFSDSQAQFRRVDQVRPAEEWRFAAEQDKLHITQILGAMGDHVVMARVITKIGDVFSLKLDEKTKKYLQYVANDLTQLNSDVIRVFKKPYPLTASPDLAEVVKGEVDFYAHCVTKWGVKLGLWEKVGRATDVGEVDVLFRVSDDYGDPEVKVSHKWYVWRINEEFVYVGRLEGENQQAEIGLVVSPPDVIHRMRTGSYDFVYPGY